MSEVIHDTTGPRELAPALSIVVPACNEADNLGKLVEELKKVLPMLDMTWEVIFVDDGSRDATWDTIETLHAEDARIKGLQFSRNFGHQYAVFAGLSNARGQVVICMDADLQHPPEVIPSLLSEWRKGSKSVNTIRVDIDKLPLFKRVTSRFFYTIFSFLSGVKLESGMADFRLFDRQALDAILSFREQGLFLRGIVQWVGFPTSNVVFDCPARFSGSTKYTLRKMLKFSLDGITSFSVVPLRIGIAVGVITSLIAFWQMTYAIYAKVVLEVTVPGWATTITVMSFMFGVLFILLGLVGEYVGRVMMHVRGRPRFIISRRVGENDPGVSLPQASCEATATHAPRTGVSRDAIPGC
jgi:dolichol-phosphate mannosyltransferase